MIEYKGYSGLMEVDAEDGVISGRVLGIRDVVTFEGQTVPEAIQAFHDSVDDYLDFCTERGVAPDKPFSGKFILRIRPELHRALAIAAESGGLSLNAFIERELTRNLPGGASVVTKKPFGGHDASVHGTQATAIAAAKVNIAKRHVQKATVKKGKPGTSAGTSKAGGR